jgi:hypothetical protein
MSRGAWIVLILAIALVIVLESGAFADSEVVEDDDGGDLSSLPSTTIQDTADGLATIDGIGAQLTAAGVQGLEGLSDQTISMLIAGAEEATQYGGDLVSGFQQELTYYRNASGTK